MKDKINKNECNDNKIEFNPDLKKNNSDISIDLIDFILMKKKFLKYMIYMMNGIIFFQRRNTKHF